MAKESKKAKKKAREDASMDFNFSDAFDEAEKSTRLTAVEVSEKVDMNTVITSGSLVMDLCIYGGGLQAGRVYDLHGEESGGKTTAGTIALIQAVKSIPGPKGKTKAYYCDAEGTFDKKWFMNIARSYGLEFSLKEIFGNKDKEGNWINKPTIRLVKPTIGDVYLKTVIRVLNAMPNKIFMKDKWMYSWSPVDPKVAKKTGGLTVKKLKEVIEDQGISYDKELFAKTGSYMTPVPNNYGGPELVILTDSMVALTPAQIAEDDSEALSMQARMFSRWMNTIKSLASSKGVTLININQLREKPMAFGDARYAPGGKAIHYVTDCRNILTPCANPAGGGQIEEVGNDTYRWTSMTNKKNKLFIPGSKIKFRWWTKRNGEVGCGLDPVFDTMDYLERTGQIKMRAKKVKIMLADHKKAKEIFDNLTLSYDEFKTLVCDKELQKNGSVIKCDLRKICLKQIRSGIAFDLQVKASGGKDEVIEEDLDE